MHKGSMGNDALGVLENLVDNLDTGHDIMPWDFVVKAYPSAAHRRIDMELIPSYVEVYGQRNAGGDPHLVRLTQAGAAHIREVRQVRADLSHRRQHLRNLLLKWVYDTDGREYPPPGAREFGKSPFNDFYGMPFTHEEVMAAAAHLCAADLTKYMSKVPGDVYLKVQYNGRICVENYDSDVSAWEARNMNGGFQLTNLGTIGAVAGGDQQIGSINQAINNTTGLDAQQAAEWIDSVAGLLSAARLPEAELVKVQGELAALRSQVETGELETARTTGRSFLETLGAAIPLAQAAMVVDLLNNLREIGEKLFS